MLRGDILYTRAEKNSQFPDWQHQTQKKLVLTSVDKISHYIHVVVSQNYWVRKTSWTAILSCYNNHVLYCHWLNCLLSTFFCNCSKSLKNFSIYCSLGETHSLYISGFIVEFRYFSPGEILAAPEGERVGDIMEFWREFAFTNTKFQICLDEMSISAPPPIWIHDWIAFNKRGGINTDMTLKKKKNSNIWQLFSLFET